MSDMNIEFEDGKQTARMEASISFNRADQLFRYLIDKGFSVDVNKPRGGVFKIEAEKPSLDFQLGEKKDLLLLAAALLEEEAEIIRHNFTSKVDGKWSKEAHRERYLIMMDTVEKLNAIDAPEDYSV